MISIIKNKGILTMITNTSSILLNLTTISLAILVPKEEEELLETTTRTIDSCYVTQHMFSRHIQTS